MNISISLNFENVSVVRIHNFARHLPVILNKLARRKIQLPPKNHAILPISSGCFTHNLGDITMLMFRTVQTQQHE